MPWLCEMLTLRKSWIKVIRELSLQSFKSSVKSKIISPDFFLRAKLRLYQQQSRALTHHRLETSLINHTHAYKPIMFIESFSINVLGPIMDQALWGLHACAVPTLPVLAGLSGATGTPSPPCWPCRGGVAWEGVRPESRARKSSLMDWAGDTSCARPLHPQHVAWQGSWKWPLGLRWPHAPQWP